MVKVKTAIMPGNIWWKSPPPPPFPPPPNFFYPPPPNLSIACPGGLKEDDNHGSRLDKGMPETSFSQNHLKGDPRWRSAMGPIHWSGIKEFFKKGRDLQQLRFSLLKTDVESHENMAMHACCHFVSGSLCLWCHQQCCHVWRRYLIFCSSRTKSEPTWLHPEQPKFKSKKKGFSIAQMFTEQSNQACEW